MDHCPFCQKVRYAADEMGVTLTLIDAERGSEGRAIVESLGGQSMVPFLVDETNPDNVVMMYESDDIIAYLKEHHAQT